MDILSALASGFSTALSPEGLMFTLIGILLGQIIGILPGIGPAAGMALLLPVTFGLDPTLSLIMLTGIMYRSQYGGTITSVLINVPGDASSLMTAIDGNQLALKGRGGVALSIAAIGSFLAGVSAVTAVVFAAPALSGFALRFSSPEYFLLATLGLISCSSLGTGAPGRALLVAAFGLILALVGTDPISGSTRLTFGVMSLIDGIDFLPVAIGLFGIGQVLASIGEAHSAQPIRMDPRDLWPRWSDWVACRMAMLRGGLLGFVIGVMPGGGAAIASLMAYFTERRFSKNPEMFGRGALDGIAAAESANNAAAHSHFVPMLALGIPSGAGTAVLLGALILHGIHPGPSLMTDQPRLVWGLIASMFTGNLMLLLFNLPMAPLFAMALRIPYAYLAPPILLLSLVGAYASTQSLFTVGLTVFFGILGYVMIKADIPRAPLVLSVVLAPVLESSLRQSLMFSRGSLSIFVERPISAVLLVAIMLSLFGPFVFALRRKWLRRSEQAASGGISL